MSYYDVPVSANRLIELPLVFKYLDRRYGSPDIKNPKKKNGEYVLRLIIKYLSYHKRSTCEEIAQYEYDNNLSSQIKLKSITDDIRKFIKNNLIYSEIVFQDEPKKKYNKQLETYSLSAIGILYSMYLLGNFREADDFEGYDLLKIDQNLIKSLGKEYSDTLPKVFGRFTLFEKILGKDFVSFLIKPFIAIYELERAEIPTYQLLLTDHVLTSYEFLYAPTFHSREDMHNFIADQISLIFYIHFEESMVETLEFQDNDFEKYNKMGADEFSKFIETDEFRKAIDTDNKNSTAKYRDSLYKAREMWIQIMNEDKELKKWYDKFLQDVTRAKRLEYGIVWTYKKEVYSHWNFPSKNTQNK